jgi:uncharacterized protein (TIGR02246 family)
MRILVSIISLAFSCSIAFAGPKEDALQVLENWTKAFSASDVDAIVKLYSPDASFLGTGSKSLVVMPDGIRKYFEAALNTEKPRGATLVSYEAMPLSDTAVIVTGLDSVTGVKEGTAYARSGRVTFVVAKRGADWQIVHFHRSAMPN